MIKYKALEEMHEALVKENENNRKDIASLKEDKSSKTIKDQDSQYTK